MIFIDWFKIFGGTDTRIFINIQYTVTKEHVTVSQKIRTTNESFSVLLLCTLAKNNKLCVCVCARALKFCCSIRGCNQKFPD